MIGDGMRVFITGATGFVGGALARALAREGADVHGLARPTALRSSLNDVAITWHEGDIVIPETLDGFGGADWIIHAAGRLGEAGVPEEAYRQVHVEGTRNVLTAALGMRKRPRVLHVSSPGVLGPIKGGPATEAQPPAPSNAYGRTKAAGERVVGDFSARGLPVIIVRPEFVYGPGDRHVLGLFRAIQSGQFFYLDGGRHVCHPTYIDDVVSGILACMSRGKAGETYHITGPQPVTFRELGEAIANALGVHPPWLSLPVWLARVGATGLESVGRLIGWKPPLSRTGVAFFSEDHRLSWQKARNELGYSPYYDLTAGVSNTVEWYRKQGWL